MKLSSPMIALASLCAVSTALATTYVRVEKDGTKTYSDRPIPGGQPVELQPAQTYSSPAQSAAPNPNLPREQQLLQQIDDFAYQSCTLTPPNDSTFTNPESVPISLATSPALRPFDTVALTIDGQAVSTTDSASYTLMPVLRGTHTALATVKNQFGKVLCTASISFHVMRPSIRSPGRR